MPVDVWKEAFLAEKPEPSIVELFVKLVASNPKLALEEAARKVRAEVVPDALVAWQDPLTLVAIASLHYTRGTKPKVLLIEEPSPLVAVTLDAILRVHDALVMPVKYPIGAGRARVKDSMQKLINIAKGASLKVVDVTDAPGIVGAVLHRAGVRWFTVTRRKGYEVLVEKVTV